MTVMTYWEYKQTQEALSLGAKDDTFTLPDYQKGYLRAVLDSYICNQYQNVDEDDLPRRAFYSDTTNEHLPASAFGKNPSEHYVLLAGDRYEV